MDLAITLALLALEIKLLLEESMFALLAQLDVLHVLHLLLLQTLHATLAKLAMATIIKLKLAVPALQAHPLSEDKLNALYALLDARIAHLRLAHPLTLLALAAFLTTASQTVPAHCAPEIRHLKVDKLSV